MKANRTKQNYDAMMYRQMHGMAEGEPLLLHACCAPCSSAVLERIGDFFRIDILFFNPNITDRAEYQKRLSELYNFVESFKTKYPVSIIEGEYNPSAFFDIAKGLENEPEKGARCYKCYRQRIEKTAQTAAEKGYRFFTTTLSLSPHKNTEWINLIGAEAGKKYGAEFLYCDFKKKNGYKRSIELSAEYGLYRQDYCGCIFSKIETEKKRAEKNRTAAKGER